MSQKITDRALDALTMTLLRRLLKENRMVVNATRRDGSYGYATFPRPPAALRWDGRVLRIEDERTE